MRSVTCPDCGAPVQIPTVHVGQDSVIVECPHCKWADLDELYHKIRRGRGLAIFGGGGVEEMACWTCVPPGPGLQAAMDGIASTGGGNLMLQEGTYTGDITFPTTAAVNLYGSGMNNTILTGNVTITTGFHVLEHLWVMGTGKAYGVKLVNTTAGVPRVHMTKVRIGGDLSSATGPSGPGLWLDGAILTVCDHCLFYLNGSDGVYINTTSVTDKTTNVNTFRDCTINLNGGYGVKTEVGVDGVAGMQQNVFLGGNMEDNALGVAYIDSSFYTRFDNVDFESSINLGSGGWLFNGSTATYIIIENCGVSSTGDTGRLFVFSSCVSCRVNNNRIRGQFTRMDIGVFDENCRNCTAHGNAWYDGTLASGADDVVTPRWINNRSTNHGWT